MVSNRKTLALCIPAYNAEVFLPRLLMSAKNQEIPFDEILVYNDCSKDKTSEVATKWGASVIEGKVNKGCSEGKNVLAKTTTCDFIHFHDADDELLPNFSRLAHKWMQGTKVPDVVLFNYEYRDNDSNELLSVRRFAKEKIEEDAIEYAISEQINPFCGLYYREAFLRAGGYDTDPAVLYNEDCAMHIRLAVKGLSFSVEHEVSIINYRVNASMSSGNKGKCLKAQMEVMKKAASDVNGFESESKYKSIISRKLWMLAGNLGSVNDWKSVQECISFNQSLGSTFPVEGSKVFKMICRINSFVALRAREMFIRSLYPSLRSK